MLLTALLDGPAHGYEVIRRLEARSGGMWRPSAGSVYPTLQLLEEEGLLRAEEADGKRVYELTDTGRSAAEAAVARGPRAPWARDAGPENGGELQLREAMEQLQLAARQVMIAGTPPQMKHAAELLATTRQQLYRLLAEA